MSFTKTKSVRRTVVRRPKTKTIQVEKIDVSEEEVEYHLPLQKKFQPVPQMVLTFVASLEDNEEFFESLRNSQYLTKAKKASQKTPPPKKGVVKKGLVLNKNKWGNLANGLLVFYEFETDCEWAEESTTVMCIGYQNLKMDPNLEDPWSTVLPLNTRSLAQFANLEEKTDEKIHCLTPENYELITSEEQKVELANHGLIELTLDDEDDAAKVNEAEETEEETLESTPKKKGWFSWIW